jgi:hypothetical protein
MESGGAASTGAPQPLGQVLEFSADELALNRNGQLSDAQRARVIHQRRVITLKGAAIALVVVVFLVVLGLVEVPHISSEKDPGSSSTALLVVGVLVFMGLVLFVGMFRVRRQMQRYTSGQVSSVEGIVSTRKHLVRGGLSATGAFMPSAYRYELTIGELMFLVEGPDVLDAFEAGHRYRGYYAGTKRAKSVLSAEPVPTTTGGG